MKTKTILLITAAIATTVALAWSGPAGAGEVELTVGYSSHHLITEGLNEVNPGASIGWRERVAKGLSLSLSVGHVTANSFGNSSTYAAAGIGYRVGWISAGVRVGGVTGYEGLIRTPEVGGVNVMAAPYLEVGTDSVGIRVNLFGEAIYPELVVRF